MGIAVKVENNSTIYKMRNDRGIIEIKIMTHNLYLNVEIRYRKYKIEDVFFCTYNGFIVALSAQPKILK